MSENRSRKEIAMDYFLQGYNCSQSVVLTYSDLIELDKATLMKLSSSFGGGMGRLREVCGCFSGICIVLGLLYGYSGPETGELKAQHYERIQQLAKQFEEQQGSIVCRELLGLSCVHDSSTPSERTEQYYKKRPCKELVGFAAELLDKYISQL